MLVQRVITAFVLLFIILGAVFGLPSQWFNLFIAMVIGVAIWEWSALTGLKNRVARAGYLFAMIVLFTGAAFVLPASVVFWVAVLFWVLAFILVLQYPEGSRTWGRRWVLMVAGLPLFLPGWLAFMTLRAQEYYAFHILLMMALVASADIGAYFAGRAFGRHKLAERVSPNKTWEGVIGGVAACCLLIVVLALSFTASAREVQLYHWGLLLLAAICIAAISVVGDLFESMIKRYQDVKDSGAILPGHGGMLDRIDGLTAAAPVYALILLLFAPEIP